jgi:TPR repeat protein
LYEQGEVVKQDYKEAYKWYAQLACRGEIDAHYKTGLFYLEGKGVKQNIKEALARIRKAASFGSKEAKEKLLELGEK